MKRLALLPEHSTLLWVPVEEDLTSTTPTTSTDTPSSPVPTGIMTASGGSQPSSGSGSGASGSGSTSGSGSGSSSSSRRSSKEWPVLRCDNLFVLPGIMSEKKAPSHFSSTI